ncbi:enoyl-CoA hydratase [Acuticoccus kandeliae]|uniref:enoyl-CoA hydratase n=1 Tax=Acuticoccus kandeliae TaxID=2073160 RepID=UPI000D3E5C88|nr:enoyl-CoA hydratase [Acuticoccus kandeliae]
MSATPLPVPEGSPPIHCMRDGAVQWVVFNRPASMNAMTHEMEEILLALFAELAASREVGAVVFTGAPGKRAAFMAGSDFGDLGASTGLDSSLALEAHAESVVAALEALALPTVAAIAGPCIGAGAIFAAACDVRIAAPSARFGFPIARTVGNCLTVRNLSRLADLVGPGRTKDMIFSARLWQAPEMLETGLVREVSETDDALLPRAAEVALELASFAPLTLGATKEAMRRMREAAIGAIPDDDLIARCYTSADYAEGVSAFLEKRRPVWSGR